MKIQISVIIPFYDDFKLLKRAIYSVQSQSFKNYELIIIYDNPEDKENIKLLKEFVKNKKIGVDKQPPPDHLPQRIPTKTVSSNKIKRYSPIPMIIT